jgi:carbamoyltransferase|tara:strand:- start:170 stop:1759 length:1590 start_codon:yes stop_codon:yes gene_type:complete
MKIAGLCSGHDCAYAILDNGIPKLHLELERYLRVKEPIGDSLKFLYDTYDGYEDIKYFTHCLDTWSGGIPKRYPNTYQKMRGIVEKNNGEFLIPGHHESHAANAFFSSNFDDALIVTIDGGGRDYDKNGNEMICTFTIWKGEGNKITPVALIPESFLNLGVMWAHCTEHVFGLSAGHPKGNQAGSVMAMAVMGDPDEYFNYFHGFKGKLNNNFDFARLKKLAQDSEKERFNIAAALQKTTEVITKAIIDKYLHVSPSKNLCLSGGVVLNSVMSGKMYDWYENRFDNIYMCPVPYDAGLAIGAAQWVWHQKLDNPRIKWDENATPYLGEIYNKKQVQDEVDRFKNEINFKDTTDEEVLEHIYNGKIVSVFGGGSESGRRALGNRSILADPRDPKMKDKINEKVKHRQWYRPFAPSIMREHVKDWFVKDISSPYMGFVLKFKESVKDKVPAVVHYDGSGRLQTVTEKDNKWYYNFLKMWKEKSGVPILLNTSFNDREPIVESPKDAIKCFLGTEIDYLYFCNEKILVKKSD